MKLALRTAVFCAATTLFALPSFANCTGGPFNGPYIGGTLGYAHLRAEHSDGVSSPSDSDGAFAVGAHIGYNIQCGRVVGGVEADINYADLSASNFLPGQIADFHDSSIDWFGTVRGRLGVVVHPRALLYATAGLAYADVEQRLVVPALASFSDTEFKTGWTVGGGIELLHHGRWMLRTEVLYVDLGDNSRTYTIVGPCGGTCISTRDFDESFWVARVGLSLKLHHEPKPVPLK